MRVRLDRHERGLWVNGPKDATPSGGMRRFRGVRGYSPLSLRSRFGFMNLHAFPDAAQALARYKDTRYQVHGPTLARLGTTIDTLDRTTHVRPLVAPPTAGVPDRLFLSGALSLFAQPGRMLRIEPDTATLQAWGVTPPPDGAVATVQVAKSRVINSCDSLSGLVPSFDPAIASPATKLQPSTFIKQEGTAAWSFEVPKDSTGYIDMPLNMDLTKFDDGSTSPEEDWIAVGIRFDRPRRIESLQFIFTIGASNGAGSLRREVVVEDHVSRDLSVRPKGIAEVLGVKDDENVFIASNAPEVKFKLAALEKLGKVKVSQIEDTWLTLLLPKTSFVKDSDTANLGWSSIVGLRIAARTNQRGKAILYVDNIRLVGGVGMQGDYQYHFTFQNSVTGSRSNANPTPVKITDVARGGVLLTNLPVSTESGVDRIEIWRTLGNGERFWRETDLANGITAYSSVVADYAGLSSAPNAEYLQPEELPTDNLVPSVAFIDAVYHVGRVFWITSEPNARGRV